MLIPHPCLFVVCFSCQRKFTPTVDGLPESKLDKLLPHFLEVERELDPHDNKVRVHKYKMNIYMCVDLRTYGMYALNFTATTRTCIHVHLARLSVDG